jgi:hypothetical protein
MKPIPIIGGCTVALLIYACGCANAADDNAQVVPLERIWAWDMPGTRDIRELEPEYFERPIQTEAQVKLAERSLTSQILQPLSKRADKQPKSAFVVKGVGYDALKNAHAVLAGAKEPTNSLTSHDEATLVFFSHIAGTYVHLNKITRQRDRIEIRYELVPHIDAELTYHVALIPMGKLPHGQYKVRVFSAPLDEKYADWIEKSALTELASHSVCKPFDFVVREAERGE